MDRQTDRHTNTLMTILRIRTGNIVRNGRDVNHTVDPSEDGNFGECREYERPSAVIIAHQVEPVDARLTTLTTIANDD